MHLTAISLSSLLFWYNSFSHVFTLEYTLSFSKRFYVKSHNWTILHSQNLGYRNCKQIYYIQEKKTKLTITSFPTSPSKKASPPHQSKTSPRPPKKAPDTTASTDLVTQQEYKHTTSTPRACLVTFRRSSTINTLFGFNCEPRVPWGLRAVTYLQAASGTASGRSNLTSSSSPFPFCLTLQH